MGFRVGYKMVVWNKFNDHSDKFLKFACSISHKDNNNKFIKDFSDYVIFCGNAKEKAKLLEYGDTIELKEIDVTNKYVDEKKQKYYNFIVYDFDIVRKNKTTDNMNIDPETLNKILEIIKA